jgi:hypothetical protein
MFAPVLKSRKALDTSVRHASAAPPQPRRQISSMALKGKNSQCPFKLGVGNGAVKEELLFLTRPPFEVQMICSNPSGDTTQGM